MATLPELSPEVRIEVPDCPMGLINKTFINVIRDFCWQTHHWQYAMEAITLLPYNASAPDTYIYTLPVPTNTELVSVINLIYEGLPLRMCSPNWLDEHQDRWRDATGEPKFYLMMSDKQVRFIPASDQVRPLAVAGLLALRPNRVTNEFDDGLMEFDQAIISGAISRLLVMPGKLWSSRAAQRRSVAAEAVYSEGVSQAKMQVLKGFSEGVETIVRRPWS